MVQSTATQSDGTYRLPALVAGAYNARVTPLDPTASSLNRLITGNDLSPDLAGAQVNFLPTLTAPVSITAEAATLNFTVNSGTPAFRVTRIIPPAATTGDFSAQNAPTEIAPGASGVFIGVAGPTLPTSGATLEITGTGVTLGTTRFLADPFGTTPPLHTIYSTIHVDADALPGLRSFIVRSGSDVAYANGFLEITPLVRDDNFDGLDDAFQRKYFPVFTSFDASPLADPDNDGSINSDENGAGTDPTLVSSILRVDRIDYNSSGARVRWQSVLNRRYQLMARDVVADSPWLPIGSPVIATSAETEENDPGARGERYYRVEVLP